jgi:hypothetical protein
MQNSIKFSTAVGSLLAKVHPEQVVWKTMSGNITAAQMQSRLDALDDVALQWVTGFVRFARDVFACGAALHRPLPDPEPSDLFQARTVDVKAFSTLLKESFVDTDIVFWTSNIGEVTRDQMLAEFDSGGDVAVQYIGVYIKQMRDMLNGTRD